ncbi:MAG TPA: polysaccharide deacetylase family protein [Bacteroidales bacterium]|nr:polysaccharide deacetylase family protein [Bacteroidales bacterium]
MKYSLIFSITLLFLPLITNGQIAGRQWQNHSCAVVLTYDDGLNVHLDKVIPSLDSVGLKGTFYIPANAATIAARMDDWKRAAENGHELGNHTLFHPCSGSPAGREWVSPDYDLDTYTLRRFMDEIKVSNTVLKMIDGKEIRTFAYTCGDMKAGEDSFYEEIQNEFISARGVISRFENSNADLFNIGAFMINGQTGDQMIDMVKQAMKSGSLLVFLFHGVGGEHSLNVDLNDHNRLVDFLKANEKEIWVPTFLEVSQYLRK